MYDIYFSKKPGKASTVDMMMTIIQDTVYKTYKLQ